MPGSSSGGSHGYVTGGLGDSLGGLGIGSRVDGGIDASDSWV